MLSRQLELAGELTSKSAPVVVLASDEEHGRLRALVGEAHEAPVIFVSGPPRADSAVLRTDRLYHAQRLRKRLRRGRQPESAVLWRLDAPASLEAADQELTRRLTYQPLGKYWAFPLAEQLAEFLRESSIRPNAVTLAAFAFMLCAAALVAVGAAGWAGCTAAASALALALVLDTADGRLARLQGTSSALGRWLDQVLDELADIALHTAIAWACYCRDGRAAWLLIGIIYAAGKHLFMVQSLLGDELEGPGRHEGPVVKRPEGPGFPRLLAALRMAGHADVRWHLWIVLALFGRLDVALAAYAAYYPARALGGVVRKVVRHA
jgi:hypothetical protein